MIAGWLEEKECCNITTGEREALRRLSLDSPLVIKPADMDREQYVREANRQLEDQEFFKLLTKPVFMDSVEEIKQELDTLQKEGHLTKSQVEYITGQGTPRG